jgi:hypothetical protein
MPSAAPPTQQLSPMAIVRRLFMALLLGVHRIHSAEAAAAALYP